MYQSHSTPEWSFISPLRAPCKLEINVTNKLRMNQHLMFLAIPEPLIRKMYYAIFIVPKCTNQSQYSDQLVSDAISNSILLKIIYVKLRQKS